MLTNQALRNKLKTLPLCPGVYFHKDTTGAVIYVGKATCLKNRVMQYFNTKHIDPKTQALVRDIAMTDWIETDSEIDALFLENEMIKRYLPRYNILLRDNKNVCYVRINFTAEWPTVTITRLPTDDRATYIGPFYSATPLRKALRCLRKAFPYLTKLSEADSALLHQIHLVPGKSSDDYHADLHMLVRYLHGDWQKITNETKQAMHQASNNLRFEQAATLRNRLNALQELKQQIIFGRAEFIDIAKDKAIMGAQKLFQLDQPPRRIEAYDISHHGGRNVVGSMVVFTNGVADKQSYRKFKISRERNNDFAAMAEVLTRRFSPKHKNWFSPDLIVVDGGGAQLHAVSHLTNGIPLIGLAKDNDLIIVHETESHINCNKIAALLHKPLPGTNVTFDRGYYTINLHAGAIHTSGHSFTFIGSTITHEYTDLLKLLQRARDESHRFALAYHNSLKRKTSIASELDDIPGIGTKRQHALLKHFGSINKLKAASEIELVQILGTKLAHNLYSKLHSSN